MTKHVSYILSSNHNVRELSAIKKSKRNLWFNLAQWQTVFGLRVMEDVRHVHPLSWPTLNSLSAVTREGQFMREAGAGPEMSNS